MDTNQMGTPLVPQSDQNIPPVNPAQMPPTQIDNRPILPVSETIADPNSDLILQAAPNAYPNPSMDEEPNTAPSPYSPTSNPDPALGQTNTNQYASQSSVLQTNIDTQQNKSPLTKILVAIFLVAGFSLIVAIIIGIAKSPIMGGISPLKTETESIFVPENNDQKKFAIFNKDGKQITDFEYVNHSDFINGYALVQNSDLQYGIVDENGKISFGWQDDPIYDSAGLYHSSNDIDDISVFTGNGQKITTLSGHDQLYQPTSSPIAVITRDDGMILYAANGKKLDTISDDQDNCSFNDSNHFFAVTCTDHTLVYDTEKLEKTIEIQEGDKYTYFEAHPETNTYLFIKDAAGSSQNDTEAAVYINGTYKNLNDACKYIHYRDTAYDADGNKVAGYLVCKKNDANAEEHIASHTYLIDQTGKITDIDNMDNAIYDATHFAIKNPDSGQTEFFIDGQKVDSIDCINDVTALYNAYSISCKDKALLYSIDGKEKSVINEKYASFRGINANGITIVGRMKDHVIKYELTDASGQPITDDYDRILMIEPGLFAAQNYKERADYREKKTDIYNQEGAKIIENADCDTAIYDIDTKVIICESYPTTDSLDETKTHTTAYLSDGKEIFSLTGEINVHFSTKYHVEAVNHSTNEVQYYSLPDGKLFYTVK